MPTLELEPRYFERMASSLSDKARMVLPWLRGPAVLDVGAGGGELAAASARAGFTVSALDASPDAIERLNNLGLHCVRLGYAEQAPELFAERFDTIVASALMHEVYSYGVAPESELTLTRYDAVRYTLDRYRDALKPGGRLVIRDGVMPPRPSEAAHIAGLSADDIVAFHDYMARTPHAELRTLTLHGSELSGTRHAVAEFLFTLTWGIETFAREALERYQLFTEDAYPQFALASGFECVHSETVTQQGYIDGLSRLTITSGGAPWFAPTNALWVFERRDG